MSAGKKAVRRQLRWKSTCLLFCCKEILNLFTTLPKTGPRTGLALTMTPINKCRWTKQYWRWQLDTLEVMIMVPDILLRILARGYLQLSDFGLMVFDECHHADKNNPYNAIMQARSPLPAAFKKIAPRKNWMFNAFCSIMQCSSLRGARGTSCHARLSGYHPKGCMSITYIFFHFKYCAVAESWPITCHASPPLE